MELQGKDGKFIKGNKGYWLGKHRSLETRKKISKTKTLVKSRPRKLYQSHNCLECGTEFKSYPSENRKFCCPSCGAKHAARVYGNWKKCAFKKGRKLTRQQIRKNLRRREMSGLEKRVKSVIGKYNLPYKFVGNGQFFIERKNPDFVNTNGKKIAVEVYCKKQKEQVRGVNLEDWKRDRVNTFSKYGWDIIFIEDWQTNKEADILNILT